MQEYVISTIIWSDKTVSFIVIPMFDCSEIHSSCDPKANVCVHLLAEINDGGEENKKVYKTTGFKKKPT